MSASKIIKIKPLGFPWETQDPFLFCAYHRDEYPNGNEKMGLNPEHLKGRNIGQDFVLKDDFRMYHGSEVPGFPYHPHRGFETITINKEGLVDHSDSLGAAGRFGPNDVQWMTAGKGVLHAEMFPLVHKDKGNPLEIFQVWLNLPKASKMVAPHFKMLWSEMIPSLKIQDAKNKFTEIDVIAGALNEIQAPAPTPDSWAANPENGVAIYTIKMEAGAEWKLPKSEQSSVNRTLYYYKGDSLTIEEQQVNENHFIQIDPNEEITLQNGGSDSFLLMLQGKPIDEPVAQYGPFVMNTQEEIQEAFNDYRRTQFGGWPWPKQEQVHSRDKGRFALHADGKTESFDQ